MMPNTAVQKPRFSVAISTDGYQRLINNTLRDPQRANRFIANIMSAVAANPVLQECDPASILSAGLLGETLGLSPSPQLGEFYLVPYEDRKAGVKKAQFQIGYIGIKQLAMNTGLYRVIRVATVKRGELKKFNPFTGESDFEPILDPIAREAAEAIGYFGCYELLNGYREEIYWTREEMLNHADRYSKAFSISAYKKILNGEIKESDMWKYSSPWYTNQEAMAHKTIIRQLLKTAPKSIEMRNAVSLDNAVVRAVTNTATGSVDFVEDPDTPLITGNVGYDAGGFIADESTGEVIGYPGDSEPPDSGGDEPPQMSMEQL